MLWTDRTYKLGGVALLLLALSLIVSVATSIGIGEADPFKRDEIDDVLVDIDDNKALAIIGTAAEIAGNAAIGVVVTAVLYILFRDRNRNLALLGFAFLLANTGASMVAAGLHVAEIFLATDFAEGGAGGIAAESEIVLEVARVVVITMIVTNQIALTALGLGLISIGAIIAWAPPGATNPPQWLGWLAIFAGAAAVVSWLIAATGAAFVLFIIFGISSLIWLIVFGIWLLMQPEPAAAAA